MAGRTTAKDDKDGTGGKTAFSEPLWRARLASLPPLLTLLPIQSLRRYLGNGLVATAVLATRVQRV
jgi:hypothetical protein